MTRSFFFVLIIFFISQNNILGYKLYNNVNNSIVSTFGGTVFTSDANIINIINKRFTVGIDVNSNKNNLFTLTNKNLSKHDGILVSFIANYKYRINDNIFNIGFIPEKKVNLLQTSYYFTDNWNRKFIPNSYIFNDNTLLINSQKDYYPFTIGYNRIINEDIWKLGVFYTKDNLLLNNFYSNQYRGSSLGAQLSFYDEYKAFGYGSNIVLKNNINHSDYEIDIKALVEYLGATIEFNSNLGEYNNYKYLDFGTHILYNLLRYSTGLKVSHSIIDQDTKLKYKLYNFQYILGYRYRRNSIIRVSFLYSLRYNTNTDHYKSRKGIVVTLQFYYK